MWTPKRLYTLRLAILIQLGYRITFLMLDKDVFDIYTVIPGIMHSMVLLQFLYALLQDFCAHIYLKFYWALYVTRAAFGPVVLYLLMLFNNDASSSDTTVPAVFTGMFGAVCLFFPPVFTLLSASYFKSKRQLEQGDDPFPAFRRFPASTLAVALMAICYVLIFALTVVRVLLDGVQIDQSIRFSSAGIRVLTTGVDMIVVEAAPILLLTIFETIRQQPTVSFYWLVLNNPEFDPDRARTIPWRDIVHVRHVARGGHKNISLGYWCTAQVIIAQPIDAATSGATQAHSFNQRLFALYDEAFLLLSLQHPNIVTLFGVTVVSHGERRRLPALIMEAALCTLDTRLTEGFSDISSSDKLRMMRDIGCALNFLHDRGVTHNDIKADNILVAQDGHTLKIADLSSVRTHEFSASAAAPEVLARCLSPADRSQAYEVARHQRRIQDVRWDWQGAMDSILRRTWAPASREADVYSCGLVFVRILTGERCIYEQSGQTLLSLFLLKLTLAPSHFRDQASGRSGELLVGAIADCFDEEAGDQLQSIVQRCYSSMPGLRPTAREVLDSIAALDIDAVPLGNGLSINGGMPEPIVFQ